MPYLCKTKRKKKKRKKLKKNERKRLNKVVQPNQNPEHSLKGLSKPYSLSQLAESH